MTGAVALSHVGGALSSVAVCCLRLPTPCRATHGATAYAFVDSHQGDSRGGGHSALRHSIRGALATSSVLIVLFLLSLILFLSYSSASDDRGPHMVLDATRRSGCCVRFCAAPHIGNKTKSSGKFLRALPAVLQVQELVAELDHVRGLLLQQNFFPPGSLDVELLTEMVVFGDAGDFQDKARTA